MATRIAASSGTSPVTRREFPPGVAARLVAATVVGRVTRAAAWTRQALQSEASDLPEAAHSQAEAITYGTIRRLLTIDPLIDALIGKRRLQNRVKDVLRVGVWEIGWSHTPPPVAVSTAVESIRASHPGATGFVNAVLRQVANGIPPESRSQQLALPEWVVKELDQEWGPEETAAFAMSSLDDAQVGVRHRPGSPPPDGQPVPAIESAYIVEAEAVGNHPLQDPASVAVGIALAMEPGMKALDLAAAPGGKTLHILDLGGPTSQVVAVDRHRRRVATARRRVPDAHWVVADGRQPPLRGSFDRILVDAPCSGLGTLRRRPEIRHRVTAAEVERLAQTQREMLAAAMRLLAPNGRLVYSVCTVLSQETVSVVEDFPTMTPVTLPGRAWGGGWMLGPHLSATDGMFIAVLGHD